MWKIKAKLQKNVFKDPFFLTQHNECNSKWTWEDRNFNQLCLSKHSGLWLNSNFTREEMPFCQWPSSSGTFHILQPNKYETDPHFLKNFQNNTTVCLTIHAFCKVYECETVFVLICRTGRTISGSQLLQNTEIIKQTVVLLWKFWRKYESVSY